MNSHFFTYLDDKYDKQINWKVVAALKFNIAKWWSFNAWNIVSNYWVKSYFYKPTYSH